MDANEFREAAHAAIEHIIGYCQSLSDRPALPDSSIHPGYLRPLLPDSAPQEPEKWDAIQPDIASKIVPGLTHWQSPSFMAFFPANSSYPGMLGELYSAAFSAPAFSWIASPAITELETVMMDWVGQALGMPECFLSSGGGGGVIQGSASEAVVIALVTARERILRQRAGEPPGGMDPRTDEDWAAEEAREDKLGDIRSKLVALGSECAHSATAKAARIAGTRYRSVPVSRNNDFAMTGADLKAALEHTKSAGLVPYYLTVSLGTTSTCAVDRFEEIAEVLKDWPEIWVHVDAAYAGSAMICPELRYHLKGVEHFDSFDFNMHKWLLTNFDASIMFIKNPQQVTASLSITPPFLRNKWSDASLVTDYRDWQIPLGRRFRSIKIWIVLRTYGIAGLQAHIHKGIRLGEQFDGWLRERSDLFEIVTAANFGLVVFTVKPRDPKGATDQEAANTVTEAVYEAINASGELFLTSTKLGDVYAIRVVNGNELGSEKHMRKAFDLVVKISEQERTNGDVNTEIEVHERVDMDPTAGKLELDGTA
ncbi:hypothetical protein P152DRAFT_455380 [Eremomyces bilateralis CBS 781.70]|uniref:Aromatic-L-amino-acid decarboxylase n=1 Tax=Eremomyces bilateralis CBS 781.70 TaxID=1392243 RepID=A0A6G1GCP2_9PEZI|nr:uncharacterized protein P152DRAFT_455380 [Eremomyces bilateralis CBS 781.70]KAF1815661.1 hypothetical protein P152DRAFT_455380 [Eremomyces bilateralis CBS 781.70]